MLQITGDLFKEAKNFDTICITTNGFVKSNGEAVMGRGCAKQAAQLLPVLPKILGNAIKQHGNITQVLIQNSGKTALVAFPVKPTQMTIINTNQVVKHMQNQFQPGDNVPGWALTAEIALIQKSTYELLALADKHRWESIILPRPGCGAGELKWQMVEVILKHILDDRFSVITYK